MKRCIILMTIDQAKHYSPEQCDEIAAAFLPHEREARAMGAPVMGSGRVFHIEEASIRVEPFLIPVHWPQINGIDFGWDHPFAAVNCAWDRDSDTVYVCREYRERLATPLIHAGALKPWGEWIPIACRMTGLRTTRDRECRWRGNTQVMVLPCCRSAQRLRTAARVSRRV